MQGARVLAILLISISVTFTESALADISARFELASNRVFRGIQQTESDLIPLAGIKYSPSSNWSLGASLTEAELGRTNENSPETKYFLSYGKNLTNDLGVDISYTNYQYNTSGARDWDWEEVQLQFSLASQWAFSLGYSKNWLWPDEKTAHAELSYIYPMPFDLNLQTTLGTILSENPIYEDYSYAELGVIYPFTGSSYARLDLTTSDKGGVGFFTGRVGEQITARIGYLF